MKRICFAMVWMSLGAPVALACSGDDGERGADGSSCTVTTDEDEGIATITCDDGTSATVPGSEPGPQGPAGPQGPPGPVGLTGPVGPGCTVTDESGVVTISCPGGSEVSYLTCTPEETRCSENVLQTCDETEGWIATEECGELRCSAIQKTCLDPLEFRLAEGPDETTGRVEVLVQGVWGTVCDDGFVEDDNAATVLCRQLGYSSGTIWAETPDGPAESPIWLDDVTCTGRESFLTECEAAGVGQENCDHTEDVGVICTR